MLLFSLVNVLLNALDIRNEFLQDGGSTKRMGNLSSAFEKPTQVQLRCRDEFYSRVGNSFLNCQQLYDVAQIV
jgi:hypothetical protein